MLHQFGGQKDGRWESRVLLRGSSSIGKCRLAPEFNRGRDMDLCKVPMLRCSEMVSSRVIG